MALNPPPASRTIVAGGPQPERRLGTGATDAQVPLPLATDGVLRCVWASRWGEMLIEVAGDEVYVNGQRVERHQP